MMMLSLGFSSVFLPLLVLNYICAKNAVRNIVMSGINVAIPITLVLVLGVSGCSSYKGVTITNKSGARAIVAQVDSPLAEGDRLRYELKNGDDGEILLHAIEGKVLVGQDGANVSLDEIAKLERKEFSVGKTAAATGAGIGVAAVTFIFIGVAGLVSALVAAGG